MFIIKRILQYDSGKIVFTGANNRTNINVVINDKIVSNESLSTQITDQQAIDAYYPLLERRYTLRHLEEDFYEITFSDSPMAYFKVMKHDDAICISHSFDRIIFREMTFVCPYDDLGSIFQLCLSIRQMSNLHRHKPSLDKP